jgi:hypothetical protein
MCLSLTINNEPTNPISINYIWIPTVVPKLEKVDEDGKLLKCLAAHPSWKAHQAPKQLAHTSVVQDVSTDEDDQDYELPGLDTPSDSDSDGEQGGTVPSNAEVRHLISCIFVTGAMTHSFV